MGLWGRLFGTEKVVEAGVEVVKKATDGIIDGIDAAFYTEEEKAKDLSEITKMRMAMVKDLQDEFMPRALTRRLLACIVFGNVFLHINAAIVLFVMGKHEAVEFILKLVGEEMTLASIIAFFYFGYYGIQQIKGK
jgi:hypothetical protein